MVVTTYVSTDASVLNQLVWRTCCQVSREGTKLMVSVWDSAIPVYFICNINCRYPIHPDTLGSVVNVKAL